MELTNENIDDKIMICFGQFDSEESADEIIEKIYESRNFNRSKILL